MGAPRTRDDPHFRRTLREAWLILLILVVATVVVLTLCFNMGYKADDGLRAPKAGTARFTPEDIRARLIHIVLPRPTPQSPIIRESYILKPGFEAKVKDGQAVEHNTLLAGPPFDPAKLPMVAGFPAWVFWGILVPKAACVALSIWFALVFMKDHAWARGPGDGPGDGPGEEPGGAAGATTGGRPGASDA